MAISKIISESLDLTDDYDFTGTVTGAGGVNTPIVYAQANAATSCEDNTSTKIELENEIQDTASLMADSRFTVTAAHQGLYLIIFQMSFNHTALQKMTQAQIRVNNTIVAYGQINAAKSSNHTTVSRTSIVVNLSTNDYVEFFGRQESGGTKTSNGGIYTNAQIIKLIS